MIDQYYAKVIADSKSSTDRLITIECRFPHIILPQVNKHGSLAQSAQSSRAIATSRRIDEVRTNPFIPAFWGKNQKGMVAEVELEPEKAAEAASVWMEAANAAADYAQYLLDIKVHKQIVNRVLEPYTWQTNVMTGNLKWWNHLIRLREHSDAQPEFATLAKLIRMAIEASDPVLAPNGYSHLPYISQEEREKWDIMTLQRSSVARVARTSYGNQGGWDIEKDLELEDRLFNANPRHDLPFEMVASPWVDLPCEGRYEGWLSLRHRLEWDIARKKINA